MSLYFQGLYVFVFVGLFVQGCLVTLFAWIYFLKEMTHKVHENV